VLGLRREGLRIRPPREPPKVCKKERKSVMFSQGGGASQIPRGHKLATPRLFSAVGVVKEAQHHRRVSLELALVSIENARYVPVLTSSRRVPTGHKEVH
jgi:hypothetical protein